MKPSKFVFEIYWPLEALSNFSIKMWTEETFWKLLIGTETKPIEEVSKAEDQKDELSVAETPRYVIFSPTLKHSLMHKKKRQKFISLMSHA